MARQSMEAYFRGPSAFHSTRQCQYSARTRLMNANSIEKWLSAPSYGVWCGIFAEIR